jgi:hypothetical protein
MAWYNLCSQVFVSNVFYRKYELVHLNIRYTIINILICTQEGLYLFHSWYLIIARVIEVLEGPARQNREVILLHKM